MEIIGEDIAGVNFGFSGGDNMASKIGDLLWCGPLNRLLVIVTLDCPSRLALGPCTRAPNQTGSGPVVILGAFSRRLGFGF